MHKLACVAGVVAAKLAVVAERKRSRAAKPGEGWGGGGSYFPSSGLSLPDFSSRSKSPALRNEPPATEAMLEPVKMRVALLNI